MSLSFVDSMSSLLGLSVIIGRHLSQYLRICSPVKFALSQRTTKPKKKKKKKKKNGMCTQRRLRSAWASAQSDQSLRCPHEEKLGS